MPKKLTSRPTLVKLATVAATLLLLSASAFCEPLAGAKLAWPQETTGRQADPAVRFGTLPNGLRYAVMHNETPSNGVAMRLRIGAGSLVERDDEQGLAHLLEHMAFRGSTHVPDGEVVHMLERQGLRFGPDTNAFTAQEQTVYTFNFPKADALALDTGFTLFREIGDRLLLNAAELQIEKGVVLSEERVRDVPAYRSARAEVDNALAGTRVPSRWPIGLVQTIQDATPQRLRHYYGAHYRPDNATLIVVGNVDVAAVAAQIEARFADWQAGPAEAPVDLGTPQPKEKAVEFVAPGVPERLSLSWVRPADRRADSVAVEQERFLRLIALTVFNNRLSDLALKPGSPLLGAMAAAQDSLFGAGALTQVTLAAPPEKLQSALDAVVETQRRLLRDGIQAAELQRAVSILRTQLQATKSQAATRKSAEIADDILRSVDADQVYTNAAQDLGLAEEVFASATPQRVQQAFARAFDGQGPIVFRSVQANPVTGKVLESELAAAYAAPLGAAQAEQAIAWPYGSFGPAGAVKSRAQDAELGATLVEFANGTRLIVKTTAFAKDKIDVAARFGNGRSGVPGELQHALWALPFSAIGGTGKLSTGEIQQWAQAGGKSVQLNLTADAKAFNLSAATRPVDLNSQMQLLAAFARDPGFRPELAEKVAAVGPMVAGQVQANAAAVFTREVQRVLQGGDARFGDVPTAQDIADTRATDLPAILRTALAGPADIVIVGDVGVEQAIQAVQSTFGAGTLGPRSAPAEAKVTPLAPRDQPFVVRHGGRADQAYFGRYWPLPDYQTDPRLAVTARLAAVVLQARLVDSVREKLGITYSPQVESTVSLDVAGLSYLGAIIETPPDRFDTFAAVLQQQLADLADKPIGSDELERARQPLVQARLKDVETNGFWVSGLGQIQRAPQRKDVVLGGLTRLRSVSADDLQRFFAGYIVGKNPVTVEAVAR